MAPSEPGARPSWSLRKRALVAATCAVIFLAHGANHASRGDAWEIFWACSWVPLMVGAAVLLKSARLNAIGLVWLALGNVLWCIDLAAGGAWMWTSTLTHWGVLGLGLWAARWLGYPPGSWWRAHLLLLGWQQFTGLFTPPERNINVAFSIHPSSRAYFSSFAVYWVTLFFVDALLMFAGERIYRRWLPPIAGNTQESLSPGPLPISVGRGSQRGQILDFPRVTLPLLPLLLPLPTEMGRGPGGEALSALQWPEDAAINPASCSISCSV